MLRTHKLLFPIFILLCLVMVLSFVFCPRPVEGVVKDALNGEPVAGAVVRTGDRTPSSNETGRYDLGWLQGDPTVVAEADGYLSTEAVIPRSRLPGLRVIWPITLAPNTLSVWVCDAESTAPVTDSVITVSGWSTSADAEGRLTLRRVKTGAALSASSPGYQTAAAVFEGQGFQEFALQPMETYVHVLDLYSGEPLPAATVSCGSIRLTTDENGAVVIKRLVKGMLLQVQAADHDPTQNIWDGSERVHIPLRPNILRGVVADRSNGQPVAGATVAMISAGQMISYSITDANGRYACTDPPHPAALVIAVAGYERARSEAGATSEQNVSLTPFRAKAIYVPLGILTDEEQVRKLVDLVHQTELNAIVVDIKNDRGWLAYPSEVSEARRSDAYRSEVMEASKFLSICQQEGVYTIARLVLFKDPALATAFPEWAVHTPTGTLWNDLSGASWADPFLEQVQDYNMAIAREVAMMGFDELQFDYLRFPSDGDVRSARYAQESTLESRCKTIAEFAARLRRELQPYAVLLSADLFGMTAWVSPEDDLGIGQRVVDIAPYMDYLSPMLYPATFGKGSIDITDPILHPYEVVYRSCLELTKNIQTRVRPWLQHYSWSGVTYGLKELGLEKKAADDAAVDGWMFWNSAGSYEEKVFDPARNAEQGP